MAIAYIARVRWVAMETDGQVQVLGDDFQMLQKTTPKENLPKDYGGEGQTLDELAGKKQ